MECGCNLEHGSIVRPVYRSDGTADLKQNSGCKDPGAPTWPESDWLNAWIQDYGDSLTRFAHALTGSPEEAQDIAQRHFFACLCSLEAERSVLRRRFDVIKGTRFGQDLVQSGAARRRSPYLFL